MNLLLGKSPAKEEMHPDKENVSRRFRRSLLIVSLGIGFVFIVLASLQIQDKTDEKSLEELQAKIEKRIPLEKYEKETYCELLWKLKQVRLCACQKNFIKDIGSLTGYPIQENDLDWK